MGKIICSETLVLRRYRHGETSLIVHAFTRESGKVSFIAKGARVGGKKPPVPLVPGILLEFIWSPSTRSELQLLREVSLLDSMPAIHENLEKLAWAQAALEVLGRTLPENEVNTNLFSSVLEYFKVLGYDRSRCRTLFSWFRLRHLIESGYGIDFESDAPEDILLSFLPEEGKAVKGSANRKGISIHKGSWKILSLLADSSADSANRLKLSSDNEKEIEKVLRSLYSYVYEGWKPLLSLQLINE